MFVWKQDRVDSYQLQHLSEEYQRINMNYGDIWNRTLTFGRLPLREQWILNYVNFLACILLASDWFKDNQLLSQLTHAHYRDTVPLKRRIWHHRHRLHANGLDRMFFCYSSFKIFASLMTVSVKSWAVRSSRFDNNIFGWLFFWFEFCDQNRSKYSLHYNSRPTISSKENRGKSPRLSIFLT